MTRSLWVFNVVLAAAAALLLGLVVESALDLRTGSPEPDPAQREPRAATATSDAERSPLTSPALPSLEEFASVLQKDLFRNLLAEARVKAPPPQPVSPPPPPLPPLPTLVGTLFLGDERRAVLHDGKRTDERRIGDAVAGGTLTKIEKDRIVIERAGAPVEVLLRASIQTVGPRGTRGAAAPGAEPAASNPEGSDRDSVQTEAPDALPAQDATMNPGVQVPLQVQERGNRAALQSRWKERMEQLLERRRQAGQQ